MVADFDLDELCAAELTTWTELSGAELPLVELRGIQRMWDQPLVEKSYAQVLAACSDPEAETARILAAFTKESGAWLNALQASCLGNLLDDVSLRISVGLRLGSPICEPHTYRCSAPVDVQGRHGLSCKYSADRHSRHISLNEFLRRALVSCQVQAILEPNGVLRDDSKKRPDGMTLVPWKEGKALVWDVTCVCQTYRNGSSEQAGYAANKAEDNKRTKYRRLEGSCHFCPVGFETFGTFGPAASALLKEIGTRIADRTGEKRSSEFLRQRLSIDIQRRNAACVLGTFPFSRGLDEIFYILSVDSEAA